jgi:hypothetical protein
VRAIACFIKYQIDFKKRSKPEHKLEREHFERKARKAAKRAAAAAAAESV